MASNTKARRFASFSEEDLKEIVNNSEAENTKKLTRIAVNVFREYLLSKQISAEFEGLSCEELDRLLGRFYVELRNNKGEMYKKTTLLSYRQGIQRFLQSIRPDVDIIKGPLFRESNKFFKGMTMELKRQGQANIDHHPPISDADLIKMYDYLSSSDSAQVLQHKVFVDIMMHFGRRGRENLRTLRRTDFSVSTDGEGCMYVEKIRDEQTKNHQDDSCKAEGRMYEIKAAACGTKG
ncbi:uncharacterized protein KIAA1958-like isoform X2 [Magallana gigas]|uniref:uncharacterized protein KIAA1958-like isoform X2 n=1 Tax=Magallana gigas TaxID=29159 RepID=UPI0033410AD6